nr:Photosynthetic reaction centre, L/M [Ipomoea batatas]
MHEIKANQTPQIKVATRWRSSVYFPTIGTDLAGGSGERAEVPHLDDGFGEIGGESERTVTVSRDLRVGGAAAEELLVGVEKALVVHQALEKAVVERHRTGGVQRGEIIIVAEIVPERTTISLSVKPLLEKAETRSLRSIRGDESRAATAKMSAQETTPGHKLSSFDFTVSITSKPLADFEFAKAVFSPRALSGMFSSSSPMTAEQKPVRGTGKTQARSKVPVAGGGQP